MAQLAKNDYPVYNHHTDAQCFHCGSTSLDGTKPSEYPSQLPQFCGYCPKCRVWTWYEIQSCGVRQ